jgi:hypothetical protein
MTNKASDNHIQTIAAAMAERAKSKEDDARRGATDLFARINGWRSTREDCLNLGLLGRGAWRSLAGGYPEIAGTSTAFMDIAVAGVAAGRLFAIEGMTPELADIRIKDTFDAVKAGVLRAPYPETFLLMSFEREPGVALVGVTEESNGFRIAIALASKSATGAVYWRVLNEREAATEAQVKSWRRLKVAAFVALSLIADSRSTVTRVTADDNLNKVRLKRGKPPIPPYWKIEPPKPTVLVPNAAPAVAIAPKPQGTHASPRPHDRRGHPRHLKDDRTVWVRASRINALAPHLTRGRSYYEVRL